MSKFIKGIAVILVLLLSGCYVTPWGVRYGNHSNLYNRGYSSGYYNNNSGYYNNGSHYRSGYQNNHFGHGRAWGENHDHNNRSGQYQQGGYHSGHHGRR